MRAVRQASSLALKTQGAEYLGFLLTPYLLNCFWFEIFECCEWRLHLQNSPLPKFSHSVAWE